MAPASSPESFVASPYLLLGLIKVARQERRLSHAATIRLVHGPLPVEALLVASLALSLPAACLWADTIAPLCNVDAGYQSGFVLPSDSVWHTVVSETVTLEGVADVVLEVDVTFMEDPSYPGPASLEYRFAVDGVPADIVFVQTGPEYLVDNHVFRAVAPDLQDGDRTLTFQGRNTSGHDLLIKHVYFLPLVLDGSESTAQVVEEQPGARQLCGKDLTRRA